MASLNDVARIIDFMISIQGKNDTYLLSDSFDYAIIMLSAKKDSIKSVKVTGQKI